jgi:hypothetical protein
MGGVFSTNARDGEFIKNVIVKPGGKRQLGRYRHRWRENIERVLKERLWESVN